MKALKDNDFIFSSRYRVWRHVVFWLVHLTLLSFFMWTFLYGLGRNIILGLLWVPVYILYSYPLMYWAVPKFLLKGKHIQFLIIILFWGVAGWFMNFLFRANVYIPIQKAIGYKAIVLGAREPLSYLLMNITAAGATMIVLFKYWLKKQQEWMKAEKEKMTAELQLLKAQVHPHFLFNTLNNIYAFSLENSPKTPGLILKLSSLLSYMLYDCKAEEVLLEKEIGIMKNYIDLEKERYGNKIEISWNIEGDVKDEYLAPLLFLPFLENAFKHGTSEQLERPWLGVDISVQQHTVRCKIVNSKNEYTPVNNHGIGIQNVKKRLALIYPDRYELKMNDEENFFVVSLLIKLKSNWAQNSVSSTFYSPADEKVSV